MSRLRWIPPDIARFLASFAWGVLHDRVHTLEGVFDIHAVGRWSSVWLAEDYEKERGVAAPLPAGQTWVKLYGKVQFVNVKLPVKPFGFCWLQVKIFVSAG